MPFIVRRTYTPTPTPTPTPTIEPEQARAWCINKFREEAYSLEYDQGKPREAEETRKFLREIKQWNDEAILTLYWYKQAELCND